MADAGKSKALIDPLYQKYVRSVVRAPIVIDGVTLTVGTSCGCAVYPCDSDDVRAIRILADHRMYEDKQRSGRS